MATRSDDATYSSRRWSENYDSERRLEEQSPPPEEVKKRSRKTIPIFGKGKKDKTADSTAAAAQQQQQQIPGADPRAEMHITCASRQLRPGAALRNEDEDMAVAGGRKINRRMSFQPMNSAVNRSPIPRNPCEEMEMAAHSREAFTPNRRESLSMPNVGSSGNGGSSKRRSPMVRTNGAVGPAPVPRTPREEMKMERVEGTMHLNVDASPFPVKDDLSHVSEEQSTTDEGSPEPKTPMLLKLKNNIIKGGNPTAKGAKKKPPRASRLRDYKMVETKVDDNDKDRRNSAVDSKAIINDPREERDSFRQRRISEDEGDALEARRTGRHPFIGKIEEHVNNDDDTYGDDDPGEDMIATTVTKPARAKPRKNALRRKISEESSTGSFNDSNVDDMVVTRPSEPAQRRRPNRMHRGFDVDETRASLMSRLRESESARGFLGNLSHGRIGSDSGSGSGIGIGIGKSGSNENNQNTSVKDNNKSLFHSDLIYSLGDMGFDIEDIEMAIESTNASSLDDVPKVVEWLDNNRRKVEEEGGNNDDDGDDDRSCGETQYTKNTVISALTTDTYGSQKSQKSHDTVESDENVRELKESLSELGFSKGDIQRHKEMYRRYSSESATKMNAQVFISAMLEMNEDGASSSSASEEEQQKNDFTISAPQSNRQGRNHSSLSVPQRDSLLCSLSDMGFDKGHVENVIDVMRNSGVKKIDLDSVLGTLLDNDANNSCSARSEETNQRSRSWAHSTHQLVQPRMNRDTISTYNPSRRELTTQDDANYENEDLSNTSYSNSLSIEITPGQYAQLLKGRQTWNAMHNGTAVSGPCSICNAVLQCCPEAEYVLCPDCDVVSPLRSGSSSRRRNMDTVGPVGLGYKRKQIGGGS